MICYVTLAVAIVVLPVVLLQDISPETAFYLKAFGILTLNWFCLTTFFIFRSSKLRSTAWLTSSVVSSHTGISSGTQKTKNQLNHTAPMVLKSSTIDRSTDTPLDELVECSVLSDGLMGEHWLTRHLVINPAMALLSLQPVDSGLGTTYKLKAEVQIHSEPNDHRFVLQFPKEAVAIKIKKTRAFEKVTQIIAEIVGQDAPAPPE
ncbi:hypothetical protein DFS34DRAFT_199370 [Phlyctochytrium arcticum]|nr:hypothetical protein DFS34DRAFT_199370 [Phlyctochytrium arcticum]